MHSIVSLKRERESTLFLSVFTSDDSSDWKREKKSLPMISRERAQKILDEHNCHRARYGVAPVEWDWNLAQQAQAYANRATRFEHSSKQDRANPPQGENLAADFSTQSSVETSTAGWISEEPNYNCATNTCPRPPCGHWTQMLWEGTTKIGCGAGKDVLDSGLPHSEHLVCRYAPAGNVIGRRPVQNCTPSSGPQTCLNLSQFNGPKVPPMPAGLIPQQQQPTGEAQPPSAPMPRLPPATQRDQTERELQEQLRAQMQKEQQQQQLRDQLQREQEQLRQQMQREQQQMASNFIDVDGTRIYYAPDQARQVKELPEQYKQQLADRLRGIQPEYHPQIIFQFFQQFAKQGVRSVYGKADQRANIQGLSAREYAQLYKFVSSVPPEAQHCAIEDFLVLKGKAIPTQLCVEAAERGRQLQQQWEQEQRERLEQEKQQQQQESTGDGEKTPQKEQGDEPKQEEPEKDASIPDVGVEKDDQQPTTSSEQAGDDGSFTRKRYVLQENPDEAPVIPELITHPSEFGTTTATIVIVSVAATLVIVALIVFVVFVVRKKATQRRASSTNRSLMWDTNDSTRAARYGLT